MKLIIGSMWSVLSIYTMIFVMIAHPSMIKYAMLLFIVGAVSAMVGVAYAAGVFDESSEQ